MEDTGRKKTVKLVGEDTGTKKKTIKLVGGRYREEEGSSIGRWKILEGRRRQLNW